MREWRAHSVTIVNREMGKIFVGYLREGVNYGIRLHYDSLFRDLINWRGQLNKFIVAASEASETLFGEKNSIKALLNRFLASGWEFTRKIGGIPEHLEFDIGVRVWIEDDIDEIRKELKELYDMVIPEFKNYVTEIDIDRYKVIVMIGEWFMLDECYITSINHRWSETMVTDGGTSSPAYLDLDIGITSVYAMGRQFWDLSERIQVRTKKEVENMLKADEEVKQDKKESIDKIKPPVQLPTYPWEWI